VNANDVPAVELGFELSVVVVVIDPRVDRQQRCCVGPSRRCFPVVGRLDYVVTEETSQPSTLLSRFAKELVVTSTRAQRFLASRHRLEEDREASLVVLVS
jgi:hypothetical protein